MVLYNTHLIEAGERFDFEFTAPQVEGDYPFVCTFPGHWRMMQGILAVR